MAYSLYQDPMQSQPLVIPNTGIGVQMLPTKCSLSDPVLLRHVLCMMNVVRNFFHVYLCWRQLQMCDWVKEPPRQLMGVLSKEAFRTAKTDEMYTVETQLLSYIFDSVFCCIELYFGVYTFLWRIVIMCYSIVDDLIWQSIAYVGLFSTYLVIRRLPQIFYSKLVLAEWYDIDQQKSIPLAGLLCALGLLVVLLQVILIPATTIFLFIESNGGRFFVLWIWGFIFVLSIFCLLVFSMFGIPCFGKAIKLGEGELSDALTGVLQEFGFPPDCVYIISTFDVNTASASAWSCFCRQRVFIFENLLLNQGMPEAKLLPEEIGKGLQNHEVAAFIAHELAHWRHHHAIKVFCMLHATLLIYFMLIGSVYRLNVLYEAAGFAPSFYPPIVGYWLVYKYVMPLFFTITNCIIFYFLRYFEYSADRCAWKFGYGATLSSALLKLLVDDPVFPVVDPWYMMWYRHKPTYLQRTVYLNRLRRLTSVTVAH